MFTKSKLQIIKENYGKYSSWAIWDFQDETRTDIIERDWKMLHSKFVLIGLNISKEINEWENFHGGNHARKIKYAFNSIEHIKGAYMTDLIKVPEVDSKKLCEKISLER